MPTVLIAHESEAIREAVRRMLVDAGYRVSATVADGHQAIAQLELDPAPDGLVLDAAISGAFCYQVVERIKARGLPTRTVLVASIYNRAGYKRKPVSLHGADDYVEQHHVPDLLLGKLGKLLGAPSPDGKLVDAMVAREGETIREAGEGRLRYPTGDPAAAAQHARRLARLIVADIAMYNPDLPQLTDAAERDARLRLDLEEGRLLFELRVPREVRDREDFIGAALHEWLLGKDGSAPVATTATTPTAAAATGEAPRGGGNGAPAGDSGSPGGKP